MSDLNESIQAQLAAVRQGFVDQLPQRISTIKAAYDDWRQDGAVPESLGEFHRLIHSLTGAGATFGFMKLSEVARSLEVLLKSLQDDAAEVEGSIEQIDVLLKEIQNAVTVATSQNELPVEVDLPVARSQLENGSLIYFLEDDDLQRQNLASQLEYFGYRVEAFSNASALVQAVADKRPALILADIILPEGELAGIEAVQSIQKRHRKGNIPVIFISSRNDFDARLGAARAGGVAYFCKPVVIEPLVDAIDNLTSVDEVEPLRILIVDDEPTQAQHNALVLRQAEMTTEIVTDPMAVFDALDEFFPQLILMDMYMPGCSGTELAKVIRQRSEYVGVPIVFLSSETDRHAQLEAMRIGGDDFLTKPIKPSDLIDSVRIRAERYRTMRSFMSRDSLTGLLNHSHIVECLDHEVARAARYGSTVCYAMLDIDHFKDVNDAYGHAVGDSVIKSLSRLLQQRLRKTDIIGRYGGEEFAVIMLETPLSAAVRVMDELRERFAQIQHHSGDEVFSATLSCGIVVTPPVTDAGEIGELADKLLYQAKENGRNQVVSAE